MKKKTNEIPDFKHTPEAPVLSKALSTEETTVNVLTAIRQLEPEDQNDVVRALLKELATDRFNDARAARDASDRASKNVDVFMSNAVHLEKIIAEAAERKGF